MPVYVPAHGVTVKVALDAMPTLSVPSPGSYSTDISNRVHMPSGITITRGRQDEFSSIDPAIVNLNRVDDKDGSLVLEGGRPVRITYTVGGTDYVRATGFVESRSASWISPTGSFASSQVTIVDALARLSRRQLRSVVENEVCIDAPLSYYTLGEPEGSTSAGDSSGNGRPPLVMAGSGAAVVFGNGTGPGTDGLTAAQFTAGGKYLTTTVPAGAQGIDVWFNVPSTATDMDLFEIGNHLGSGVLAQVFAAVGPSPATLSFSSGSGSVVLGTILPGVTYHLFVKLPNGGPLTAYIDGVLTGSPLAAFTGPTPGGTLRVGGNGFAGTVSHVALYGTALTSTRIMAHSDSGHTGFAGEPSDVRVARLATYANITGTNRPLAGVSTMGAATGLSGRSVKEAMDDVMSTEGGRLFINATGDLTIYSRSKSFDASMDAPEVALGPGDIEHDDFVIAVGDKQYMRNRVKGTRPDGAAQEVADPTSLAQHEEYPADLGTLLLTTDNAVLDVLNWNLSNYSQPLDRISSVSIDMLTMPTTIQQVILGLDIGDRFTISGLPSQSPIGSTADLLVEGMSETLTTDSWRITFNTVPASLFHVWRLEDAAYGQLGTTARLAY